VFSPEGRVVELRSSEPKGLVLDRPELDKWLREKAQEKGAELWITEARGLMEEALFHYQGSGGV
jgi:flavin-dependent dehydrogenase